MLVLVTCVCRCITLSLESVPTQKITDILEEGREGERERGREGGMVGAQEGEGGGEGGRERGQGYRLETMYKHDVEVMSQSTCTYACVHLAGNNTQCICS